MTISHVLWHLFKNASTLISNFESSFWNKSLGGWLSTLSSQVWKTSREFKEKFDLCIYLFFNFRVTGLLTETVFQCNTCGCRSAKAPLLLFSYYSVCCMHYSTFDYMPYTT